MPRRFTPHIAIFCRWPEPGAAKTRLIPQFGAGGAAAIYTKLLAHTIEVARDSKIAFDLRVTGAPPNRFRSAFGEDLSVVEQGDGDLSDRMADVAAPAIIIGSDCPGLTVELLHNARDALADHSAVIGPASDGGFYLIGLREQAAYAFDAMVWSTATVFQETLNRFAAKGVTPIILPELADVDVAVDLEAWPEFLP